MKKSPLILILVLALACGLAASAGEGEAVHHIDWFSVLGKVVNSTILFGGLFLALRKPLIRMLSQKGAGIRDDFAARAQNLVATESRLREVGQRLDKVAAEVEEIKGEAEAAGKAGLARLEEAGRLEAERIITLGEEEIRQRVDAAVREVKGRIADLAIARFKEDFTRHLDNVGQQKIIERNIDACEDLDEGK
ncbi:MAG: ATP synthase F0 subunit B [Acidobacteriota bacterium]|nr:ATP synthase F0 subunit B [Acidobacteriota bacterium]